MALKKEHTHIPRRFGAYVLVVSVILTAAACQPETTPTPGTDRPNIILIVVDTLRADFVGSYGASTATPNIDDLARTGVMFSTAFSHIPATGPSHSSMFTGLLPAQHAVKQNAQKLTEEQTTIAEILRDNGYHTIAVVSLGVLQKRFGFGQGFEKFDDSFPDQWFRPGSDITESAINLTKKSPADTPVFLFVHYSDPHEPYAPPTSPYPKMDVELDDQSIAEISVDGLTNRIPLSLTRGRHQIRLSSTGPAIDHRILFRQLKADSDKVTITLGTGWTQPPGSGLGKLNTASLPATLTLEVGEPEVNTQLKFFAYEELDAAEARIRYAGEVEFVDQQIGALLQGLRESGLMDDAVVILTSDHGEGLGDHGHMGHISQLYDSLVRVPLIISAPGRFKAGETIADPAALIDITPTILDILSIEPPADLPGTSHLRETTAARTPILMRTFRPEAPSDLTAVFADDHKLIVNSQTGQQELYSSKTDPQESRNLLADGAAESNDIARILAAAIELSANPGTSPDQTDPQSLGLSDEDVERLRELGYLRDE